MHERIYNSQARKIKLQKLKRNLTSYSNGLNENRHLRICIKLIKQLYLPILFFFGVECRNEFELFKELSTLI